MLRFRFSRPAAVEVALEPLEAFFCVLGQWGGVTSQREARIVVAGDLADGPGVCPGLQGSADERVA